MAKKVFPNSNLPVRSTVELLPKVFQTEANDKFLSGVMDPLVQPGVLQKLVGYIGRRYGKTYNGSDLYVDTDETLRSRYQLEPAVVEKNHGEIEKFYDYLDFKNQLKFFGNNNERDDKITSQTHYTWNPPIDWDKFVNYREYYWVPEGPPSIPILGQSAKITSTYKVFIGSLDNSYVFTPDSFTNNPTLTLYRGQTYKFKVNAPNQPFTIRTNFDTGSLLYVPGRAYLAGQSAVFNGKLWSAKVDIAATDGSSITEDSQDWQFIENISVGSVLNYNEGVTNNGIESGTLTFTVPYDAPDVLFYQSSNNQDIFGRFIIGDIEENTFLNVEKDIIGKVNFTSSNGVQLSNGMVLEFQGNVTPSKYSRDTWLVDGVGEEITLTRFLDLTVPVITTDVPEVLFDNDGFDMQPFDDATAYPTYPDYITIRKDSIDKNSWSRYNRWFHRDVLEFSHKNRGTDFPAAENSRAKRPIIEFKDNIKLFNHGSVAKESVDYIDTFTTDVFSQIEGSVGYNVDGELLFDGARVLITADTDNLVNNKIYQVQFITQNGVRQIHMKETSDTTSNILEGVLVSRGAVNGGKMFHFTTIVDENGQLKETWIASQEKTKVNQPPLFDGFDAEGVSFSDRQKYPVSSFSGSKILGYKIGSSSADRILGFSLSYLNIDNVGDIEFEWAWEKDIFQYTINQVVLSKNISTGYYYSNLTQQYYNGWIEYNNKFSQAIVDHVIVNEPTNTLVFDTVDWLKFDSLAESKINFYINGYKTETIYTRTLGTFVFEKSFSTKDSVVIKIHADIEPDKGYYEIPVGLEKNPLNSNITEFTLGQAMDHVGTALEFDSDFAGHFPGNNNLRDISEYRIHAKRFLKHSAVAPLSLSLICDKTQNIVKALQYARKSYTQFKNNFLTRAFEIDYNDNIADFVDDILRSLTKTKNSQSAFYDSDMIGCGAFTKIFYKVDDPGIKVFALNQKFSLDELSRSAVYVYINGSQLIHGLEYEFNSAFGFVQILRDIQENDEIEIREYITTSACFIPPTPTSMGLYKKYTPSKFIDDTYREPKTVIQGHDGSLTTSFGDFRDDLLLELELRIYNNIKKQYDEKIFDVDEVISGYYRKGEYTLKEQNDVIAQEFLKWIQGTNINYTLNSYFVETETFTYTYSNMSDPTQTRSLLGYWRGVYKEFYDTDRPHRCPWEILGFSEKPDWWDTQYGSAPYTSGNLLLWEDIRDGIIRQGPRAGQYEKYKRASILSHLPVDSDGKLLSPLDSGLARDFSLVQSRGPFVFGDIGPAEHAWRISSEWPFAVVLSMILLKPFHYISEYFDSSKISQNKLNQIVNSNNQFLSLSDFTISEDLNIFDIGLVKYLKSFVKSSNLSIDIINEKLTKMDVALSSRLSGFVDKQQQKFLLDSKSPNSSTSSIFIPQENYDIIFNVSSPIASVTYSGVIFEKTQGGWIVNGYDDISPYFSYYQPIISQKDPIISVGGVSASFKNWAANILYNNGEIVRYNNQYYRALKTHTSEELFVIEFWQKIAELPKTGAVEAARRKNFNKLTVKKLSYGTLLTSIQQVIDFLLGYEQYLKSLGFVFDSYDMENKVAQDWLTSCKEFMFWTKHNWAIGSLLTVSPSAQKIDLSIPIGVADSLIDGFYDYQILKADGKPLPVNFINVKRSFQNVTVSTTETTDGIFYLRLNYVLKEHVAVFDDRTVFNDIIYEKTTGYRQERIKSFGFRTVDWDGDYTSPGFLFDNVNIQPWRSFVDYRLGDIVSYKSFKWTSLENQIGSAEFDDSKWSKLDITPEKQLVANFDYRINNMYDYFEVLTDGLSTSQRSLARHTIGYQERDYLNNLSEDSVTQFLLYQGFIREKGTKNSITKIFDKLSRSGADSVELKEEWAILSGRLGGVDQIHEHELEIVKNNLQLNPQPVIIQYQQPDRVSDLNYRVIGEDFTITNSPFSKDIVPTIDNDITTLTAGYIKEDQYQHAVQNRDGILSLDINSVNENDHIWVVFDGPSWTMLKLNESPVLKIASIERPADETLFITFNRPHALAEGDIFGIRNIENLTGFFKVTSVSSVTEITLTVAPDLQTPEFDNSSLISINLLTECRFASYQDVDPAQAALLSNGSKLFIDNNGHNQWEVVAKQTQFTSKAITDYGVASPLKTGTKVLYDNINKHVIVSMPGAGFVMIYVEDGSQLRLKQVIAAPVGYSTVVSGTFGDNMTLSPDSKYLIISSPMASGVPSTFRGDWDSSAVYGANDVVVYGGRLYKALNANVSDGSTEININSDDWELTSIIESYSSAAGDQYFRQGMISVYLWSGGRYTLTKNLVSARPNDNERFGADVKMGFDAGVYYLAVSAPGSMNNTGRVYLYTFNGTEWKHLENTAFRGVYDKNESYKEGEIVWQAVDNTITEGAKGNLWMAVDDSTSDGSTITVDSDSWLKVSNISTHSSLPTNIAIEDDGSTLEFTITGILNNNQMAEQVKQGDNFGYSLAMNHDASLLVVGAPFSDGQWFPNFRGIWRADVEYVEGEVVKYRSGINESYQYYRLEDTVLGPDSVLRSYNEDPSNTSSWQVVGDSTAESSGKIFVYKRTSFGSYEFKQMINAGSISSFSDIESGLVVATGDQFGFSMDMDSSGEMLVISSPKADINFQDQGSVYVFNNTDAASIEFRLKQKLQSFEIYPNEYFGYGVAVSPDKSRIAVGAKNTPTTFPIYFDLFTGTTFDQGRTTFVQDQGFTGGVYIFDRKDQTYLLVQKLEEQLSAFESFGSSVDCVGNIVLVGSPEYRPPVIHFTGQRTFEGPAVGTARLFKKDNTIAAWDVLGFRNILVDLEKFKKIELYDNILNYKIQDLDYVDPAKGKILNIAEQEIFYKTYYDPAVYSIGTEEQVVDSEIPWLEKNVGKLWWDLSTVKWFNYEQGDVEYRKSYWGKLAPFAEVNVYEWVESVLLPSEWAVLADTNEGLALGISGQPLYPNDTTYSKKEFFSTTTGNVNKTLYYFWVKNKTTIPSNLKARTKSSFEVANLIRSPQDQGQTFIVFADADKILLYNFVNVLPSDTALINMQFYGDYSRRLPIHSEYQLLVEGDATSLPTEKIESKWIDSLVGYDSAGNKVPDDKLNAKAKYGIQFRPRQSFFVNRLAALKIVIDKINLDLHEEPFADIISFNNLNSKEVIPDPILNLYDLEVDTYDDLLVLGTSRLRRAILRPNLINGELDTIDIIDPGFGYRVIPPIVLSGDGLNASAEATLDNQGRIVSVIITNRGKKYSTITAEVRYFSVLVNADRNIMGMWSIYSWDNTRSTWFRFKTQAYDTTRYWSYIDWYAPGYDGTSRIIKEILTVADEQYLDTMIGDIIRIKEYGNGGWILLEKFSHSGISILDKYKIVGRQNGTIQISPSLYSPTDFGQGFDTTSSYDTNNYDLNAVLELRIILHAIKNDVYVGNYAIKYNELFFSSIRYVLSEQQYVDWVFKTSFLNAVHNIGGFEKRTNYKNDNLESYQTYIDEVKPYRTTVREYASRYNSLEPFAADIIDFDLPPALQDGQVQPVTQSSELINQYPWSFWNQNKGYSIVNIIITDQGNEYVSAPKVVITGDGKDAEAKAYISNGKLSGITILNKGSGYTFAPTISLVGGTPAGIQAARAIAVLGDSLFRSFDLTVKFDRLSKTGIYSDDYSKEETFVANGFTGVYFLKYAPTPDKTKITVLKNSEILFNNEYTLALYFDQTDDYKLLRGKLTILQTPSLNDIITIRYDVNDNLLDAVNRVQKYYTPKSGMRSKDLNQLMTGIDFGGVQIQGTTFDVTGGWDALPWFTDNWDSVEASSDYYVITDGSTTSVTLPYTPSAGQQITVYLKRKSTVTPESIDTEGTDNAPIVIFTRLSDTGIVERIDDPNYSDNWDSTSSINPRAQMPTFIGDGSTRVIEIGQYVQTQAGDTLIFRPIESDGSVTITDANLLDTQLTGGGLTASGSTNSNVAPNTIDGIYASARGVLAEDISIDGGKFVSPEQVPATEENIPGQIIDSFSIKVYTSTTSGASPLNYRVIISNGTQTIYDVGQKILTKDNLLVYVDKVKQVSGIEFESTSDYVIDFTDNRINFVTPPPQGQIIEIISFGLGGAGLLDYQEFIADGQVVNFLTAANYADTTTVYATVDGIEIDVGFINGSDIFEQTEDGSNKTLVTFPSPPPAGSVVKLVCLQVTNDTDSSGLSIVKVNTERFEFEGSTRSFDITNFVELSRGSSRASMIVMVNGAVLQGVDTIYSEYDGQTNSFVLGTDPAEQASILPENIQVFINGVLQQIITDYVYFGITKTLTITRTLSLGDRIRIQNDLRAEYSVVGNNLVIDSSVNLSSNNETDNDIVELTWFSEYPTMRILTDEFAGGKLYFNLVNTPLSSDYVWVFVNGQRLTKEQDYEVDIDRSVVYLRTDTTANDKVKIIIYTDAIFKHSSAYEIRKDAFNIVTYNRFSYRDTVLAQQLNYYDQTITLSDASNLADPIPSRNIPGAIYIAGERIEYFTKNGNVLGQLRRGTYGTSIGTNYPAETAVSDVGYNERLPYNETQERFDFFSDGSTLLIGPLDFVPQQGVRSASWARTTIPATYSACDQIEVFAAGRRLRKDPHTVFNPEIASASPDGDEIIEAEFSVDGLSNYIRLTSAVEAGTRITIIKRTGKTWYDRGTNTVSSGLSLLDNVGSIPKFITGKSTDLPVRTDLV